MPQIGFDSVHPIQSNEDFRREENGNSRSLARVR